MPNPYRTHAFVSYSHKDQAWLDKLREVLAPDIRNDRIGYWDDRELQPGDPWYQEVLKAIDHARVAVLLVSPNFLASRFIMEEEVPRILAAIDDGLTVLWIPLFGTFYGPDAPSALESLAALQASAPVATPLADLPPDSLTATLLDVCRLIQRLLNPTRVPRNLPFGSLGNLFKGRDVDLTQLELHLGRTGAAAIVQPETITGMGGIGKTRLAIEYAWRHADDFAAVLFVSANTPDDVVTNFARLSETLDLAEHRFGKQDDQYAAVLRWLQQHKGWLLILDNVDTPEAVGAVKALVTQIHGGQVIITSRITGPKWGQAVRQVSLAVMRIEDAVAYLQESTAGQRPERADDVAQARALADKLGCLPLALTHASAYLRERFESFVEYLLEFEQRFAEVIAWHDPDAIEYDPEAKTKQADPARAGTMRTVATTFFMSFDRLGPMEKALLRAASFLAPEPIPVAMFEDGPEETQALISLWCEETGEVPGEEPVRDALAALARYSLVTRGDGTFGLHRIEQAILRSRVAKERVPRWVEATRAIVVRYAPDELAENPKTWPIWDLLRPHAEWLIEVACQDSRVVHHVDLIGAVAALYYGKGLYDADLRMGQLALQVTEALYGSESAKFAYRLLCCGETLRRLGRSVEAEAMFRRCVGLREKLSGPESAEVASNLNYLVPIPERPFSRRRPAGSDEKWRAFYRPPA